MIKNNIFQNNLPYHFLVVPILKYTKEIEKNLMIHFI